MKEKGRKDYMEKVKEDEEEEDVEEEKEVLEKKEMGGEEGEEVYEKEVKVVMREKK